MLVAGLDRYDRHGPGDRHDFECLADDPGQWTLHVLIAESGRPAASVPLTFEVQ